MAVRAIIYYAQILFQQCIYPVKKDSWITESLFKILLTALPYWAVWNSLPTYYIVHYILSVQNPECAYSAFKNSTMELKRYGVYTSAPHFIEEKNNIVQLYTWHWGKMLTPNVNLLFTVELTDVYKRE